MKLLTVILLISLSACKQHSKPSGIHETKRIAWSISPKGDTSWADVISAEVFYKSHQIDSTAQRAQDSLGIITVIDNGSNWGEQKDLSKSKLHTEIYCKQKLSKRKELLLYAAINDSLNYKDFKPYILGSDSQSLRLQCTILPIQEWGWYHKPYQGSFKDTSNQKVLMINDDNGLVLWVVNDSLRVIDTMFAIRTLIKRCIQLDSLLNIKNNK